MATKISEWLDYPSLVANLKDQLLALSDPAVIEEHFYDYLAFWDRGCGERLGVGINRINDYTIKRAALGLARYVQKAHAERTGVVISFDNRHGS